MPMNSTGIGGGTSDLAGAIERRIEHRRDVHGMIDHARLEIDVGGVLLIGDDLIVDGYRVRPWVVKTSRAPARGSRSAWRTLDVGVGVVERPAAGAGQTRQ